VAHKRPIFAHHRHSADIRLSAEIFPLQAPAIPLFAGAAESAFKYLRTLESLLNREAVFRCGM
jgi:hypothetical protein